MDRTLIIVGASTRGAAQSAIRAGFKPWLADQFADADLAACGPVRRIENYPWELIDIFREAPDAPWMYTGALENYPELVEQLSAMRPLWGNSAESLRGVRDPLQLVGALARAGFYVPEVRSAVNVTNTQGEWLRKHRRSAGGRNIARSSVGGGVANLAESSGSYFQRQIIGQPISATFLADGVNASLMGITIQLIGDDRSGELWCASAWTGAKGFWYAGSIGPVTQPTWLINSMARLGDYVAREFHLRGLFGIDAILTDDAVWPLEVNPRYTASVEVLERATGVRAIELHAASFRKKILDVEEPSNEPEDLAACMSKFGKAVLYATRDFQVPTEFPQWSVSLNGSCTWPAIADIPTGGPISKGFPICTVFAEGATTGEVLERLRDAAQQVAIRIGRVAL